jgi:alpha-D-xyloside xylohydrolase
MKNIFSLFILIPLLVACGSKTEVKHFRGDLVFRQDSITKRIRFYTPDIVRVTVVKQKAAKEDEGPHRERAEIVAVAEGFHDSSLAVIASPEQVDLTLEQKGDTFFLKSDRLTLRINRKDGSVTFLDPLGKVYLQEEGRPLLRDTTVAGRGYYRVQQRFRLTADEGIYGLGQFQNGRMNFRNCDLTLVQANKIAIVPVMVSTNNYGILWDNYSHTGFHDGPDGTTFTSRVAKQLDYYFMGSHDLDGVVACYRHLTGRPPLFSRKAYGFWQSRERYASFGELQEVVRRYRREGLPLDNIVQDWQYWGDGGHWSAMRFDPVTYPDPGENIRKIHDLHAGLMVSIWPVVGKESAIYKELDSLGYLYAPVHWSGGRLYDAYSPEARDIYWRYIRDGLIRYGVDALWMDGTEPEVKFVDTQKMMEDFFMQVGMTAMGPVAEYLNTYALMSAQGVYRHFREDVPGKRVFLLTRSSWAGQQRNATVTWSGDIGCSWDFYRKQIPAGINFCITGVPYWTYDIGGFFPDRLGGKYPRHMDNPAYQELYVRWFQYGAFTPIFRSHGTGKPREVYRFQRPLFYNALKKALKVRYSLLPYIYSLAWQVTSDDYTLMRGLVMDFPEDRKVYEIPDQYMFGPAFLVKPVTKRMYYDTAGKKRELSPGVTEVDVYLPAGAGWYDYWSNHYYHGGTKVTGEYPLDIFPLFVKGGSIVPVGPDVQYADEEPYVLKEIRIYAGADASFVYYEDENNNYNYEQGKYNTIRFVWHDKQKKLTIGESAGYFHGFVKKKDFRVVVISPLDTPGGDVVMESRQCRYDGEEMEISFFE